jgi:hypothetical protein
MSKKNKKKKYFYLKVTTKIAVSRAVSVSQRYGSADWVYQNVTDLQHCLAAQPSKHENRFALSRYRDRIFKKNSVSNCEPMVLVKLCLDSAPHRLDNGIMLSQCFVTQDLIFGPAIKSSATFCRAI